MNSTSPTVTETKIPSQKIPSQPSTSVSEFLDKAFFWSDKITELTRRGVENAAYKMFDNLPDNRKNKLLQQIEKLVGVEIDVMKDQERNDFMKRLDSLDEKRKWYKIYNCRNFRNICWIGVDTWGCCP